MYLPRTTVCKGWTSVRSIVAGLIVFAASTSAEPRWVSPQSTARARGVCVMVPGLNNSARALQSMADLFAEVGYHVALLPLAGSDGDEATPTAEQWIRDVARVREEARRRYPKLPEVVLGFSTGALVLAADECERPQAEHRIFLSMPLSIRSLPSLVRFLLPLRYLGVSLPSLAPEQYRSEGWTSLRAYHALFRAQEITLDRCRTPEGKATSLLFYSTRDEFIDLDESLEIARNIHGWRAVTLDNSGTGLPGHLLVDDHSFGESGWRQFREALEDMVMPSTPGGLP
jgi:hypothetical protein